MHQPATAINPLDEATSVRRLILRCHLSPGDIVMLTAALRDLHRAHPGKFITDVQTSCKELWENNPHVTPLNSADAEVMGNALSADPSQ